MGTAARQYLEVLFSIGNNNDESSSTMENHDDEVCDGDAIGQQGEYSPSGEHFFLPPPSVAIPPPILMLLPIIPEKSTLPRLDPPTCIR